MIAVIGCGRSGTKYFSILMEKIGLDVGHEKLGKHGISSWCLVPDSDLSIFGPSFSELKYLNMPIVHQIRNPLNTISSSLTFMDYSWNFIQHFIPISRYDSTLLKSMKYWYYWNLMARKKACYSYRIENIKNEIDGLMDIGDFSHIIPVNENTIAETSKRINSRPHRSLSWEEIENEDDSLTSKIYKLAVRFGYDY
jgi:hypothetical protein